MHRSLAFALRYGPLLTVFAAGVGSVLCFALIYAFAPPRRALRAAAVAGFAVFWAVLIASVGEGERAHAELGTPRPKLVSIDGAAMRWTSLWTLADRVRLDHIALSPLRWRAVRDRHAALDLYETPWPPIEARAYDETRARLDGDCAHLTELALRTGRLSDAVNLASECPSAVTLGAEARWSEARVAHCAWSRPQEPSCERNRPVDAVDSHIRDPARALLNVWWNPSSAQGETVTPASDPLRCVEVAAARIVADAPDTRWDDLLAHPHPGCRILAATRAARRDDASMRALREVSTRATGAWRPLLDLARTVTSLEGMPSGRVTRVECTAQRAVGGVDPEFLRAHPGLPEVVAHAARMTHCDWVHDQLWYPAQEALLWRSVLAGDGHAIGALVSARREHALMWDAMHHDDRRFGPHARALYDAQEPRIHAFVPLLALAALDEEFMREGRWPGGFTWAAVIDASTRPASREALRCDAGPRALPLNPDGTPAFDSCTLQLNWRTAASMQRAQLDASLVEFWRTGEWSPSRESPAIYRSSAMDRLVAATAHGRGSEVLAALGAPSVESVAMLAAVAYRVSTEREALAPWVRASVSYSPSLPMTALERFNHLDAVFRVTQRLRLAELHETLLAARNNALEALRGPLDPWLTAVLETLLVERRLTADREGH